MALLEVNWNPDRRELRSFGWIALGVFAALGTLVFIRRMLLGIHLDPAVAVGVAYALWTLALLCAVLALMAPRMLRPLYVGLIAVSLPIGYVVSHVLMAAVYFGVVTPIGLIFRLMGRDLLSRRWDPDAPSYWVRRQPAKDVRRYFRQF